MTSAKAHERKNANAHAQGKSPPIPLRKVPSLTKSNSAGSSGTKSEPLARVVPLTKVPSLRGKHSIGLHAAGSFLKAPSPGELPAPPPSWIRSAAPAPPGDADAATASAGTGLQRSADMARELQGNLLLLTLSGRFPAEEYSDLAGKITGMRARVEGGDV